MKISGIFLFSSINISTLQFYQVLKSVLQDSDFHKIQVADTLNSENENYLNFINLMKKLTFHFPLILLINPYFREKSSMIVSNKIFLFLTL